MGILGSVLKEEEEKKKLGSQFGGNWGLSDLLKETPKKEIVPEVKVEAKVEGGTKKEEPKKEEPSVFDTLNESIEKNYKQYQSLTKKLEAYQAEYDYAPDSIKPSIAANFNKLVKEHGDLVKQLQTDIPKRDQMIAAINKIDFMRYKQLTGLPGEAGYKTPLIPGFKKTEDEKLLAYKEPEKDILGKLKEKISGVFKEKPEARIAKAQVSYNISQKTGIPATEVEENLDKYTKALGIRGIPTGEEYLSVMFMFPVTAAIISNPISAGIGITKFLALLEAENLIISKAKGWEYQFGAGKGLKELTPDDTSQITKDILDVLDFVAKGVVIGVTDKGTKAMWDKFTKDVVTKYSPSQRIYLNSEKLRGLHGDPNFPYTKFEADIYASLPKGGREGLVRTAFKKGIDIETPATTITKIMDKPYWAKIKGLFNIKPFSKTVISNVKATWTEHPVALLPEPKFAFGGTKLYGGLPIDEMVNAIVKAGGKISSDIANQIKVMNSTDASLLFQQLILVSPETAKKVASQFVELIPQKITKIPKAGEGMTPEELEQFEKLKKAEIIPKEEIEPTKEELEAIKKPPTGKEKFMARMKEVVAKIKPGVPGERYVGKAYRTETYIPEHGAEIIGKMKTAQEKLNYDASTTGNPIFKEAGKLAEKIGIDLNKVPIGEMAWVAPKFETAEKYDGAKEFKLPEDTIILAKDNEGGYLILKNSEKYIVREIKPIEEPEKIEVEPTPEEIKSVFMEEGNLDTTAKNREIFYEKYNDVYTETKQGYDKLIDEKVVDLKEEGFKGVTKGGLKRIEEGEVIGAYPSISLNPKWYRDFYKKNNKAPTNKDLKEIAIEQLSEGYTEDYGEIPANPIFNKLQAQLEAYETILSDVKSGNYSFEIPKNIDKLNNKLNELRGENKKIIKEYEIRLRNQITESNKIYGQLTEELNKQKKISTKKDIKKIRDLETEKLRTGKDIENLKVKLKEIKGRIIKPIPKRIKTKIREITGQVPKKIEIAENEILKLVLRGEAKGARKAFSEGKKAGIFGAKEKYAEVVGRAKERKAVRTEIGKIKDILKKNKLRELRPERQKAIKNIIDEMDIKKMTEKTKRKLTSRLNFIKDNPDNQIPSEKIAELERLNKKPISDFTSEDIALIKDAILHEVNLNKLKNKIIFGKEIKEAAEELKEARGNVLKSKKIAEDENSIDSSKAENMTILRRIKKFFNSDSFNPEVICEELDNEDHGIIMKYIFKGIDNGITIKVGIKREMDAWFHTEIEGIDISNWSKSFQLNKEDIDFQEVKLSDGRKLKTTKGERISFLLHEKNEKNLNHLLTGGFRFSDNLAYKYKINEEDLDIITNSATPEEVKVANVLWKFFNEKTKPELNKASMELNGWEIATEDNYYPIRTVALDRTRDTLRARRTFDNKTLEGLGIFKERVNAKNALIIEDVFSVTLKHLELTSSYIGLAKPLRYAKLVLEDTEFQENVMKTGRRDYLSNLKKYLKEMEDDSINLDNADKLTVELINKLDSAILGLHLFVAFKQPVSYLIATTEMEAKYLQEAIYMKTDFKEIRQHSPQLAQRIDGFIFRELGELGNVGKVRQFFLHKSPLNSKLLSLIRKMDSFTIGKIWNAAKLEIRDKYPDLSEEEFFNKVTERAEEVIRRTQPTWHPKDRSEVGRSKSVWMRLLTKYTSQRNKNRIALKRATLKYNRSKHTDKDRIDLLKRYATILIINGLFIEAINELRRRAYGHESRSVWQYIVASIGTTLSTFYIVSDLFSSLTSKIQKGTFAGYDTGNIVSSYMDNAISGIAEVSRTIDQLETKERYKSGSRKGDLKYKTTALRALDKNASSVLALKGIPYDNIKRLVMGIWKMAGDKGEEKVTKKVPEGYGKEYISKPTGYGEELTTTGKPKGYGD